MKAENGSTVKVHYKGTLEDGTVFDSSEGREPLQFTVGSGEVIPGFDVAVTGLEAGESRTTTIPADQAYGPHHPDRMIEVSREGMPPDFKPNIGNVVQLTDPQGQPLQATVKEINETVIKFDANHPLAGKDLTFEIKVMAIN